MADPTSTVPAIHVSEVWKRYGEIEAVRGVSLDVNAGEIFGMIGPDGAGKTTLFQILAGVMEASSGVAEIFGKPAREMRSQTGYLTQSFSMYPDLSVLENIRYIGDLRGVASEDVTNRGLHYLQMFNMDQFVDRLAGQLSGGMKQKLSLACALVPQPKVLLLDEPTTGVDPVSRREFWDALAHLSADGLTILVATPYLDEAERCHRVALTHEGQIRKLGTPDELRQSLNASRLEIKPANLSQAERTLSEAGRQENNLLDVQRFGDHLDLLVRDPDETRSVVEKKLTEASIPVDEIRIDEPTLENVFVATLRDLASETVTEPFPKRHSHEELRGQVAIGATNLSRQFGSFTAVKNVNLAIKYGEVYGLLGANGAGKTTTIKMLCGLLEASAGEIELAGESADVRSEEVRQRIGYMSQKFSLYNDLSIRENLNFFGGVYGVPARELEEKRRWVLSFSALDGKDAQMTGSLPGGWKQRVAFGAAIMHEPTVLFLDEPTSGVDPLARRAFWTMINQLADDGAAILVTTHYLEESEQCNRLGLMVAGELVAEGTPHEIKERQPGHLLEISVDQPQRAADFLKQELDSWRVSLFGDRLHVITDDDPATGIRDLRKTLETNGVDVRNAREGRFSMEDVFISVISQAAEQAKTVGSQN